MREEFEKLDEVKWILDLCEYNSERNMYDAKAAHCEFDEYHTNFVNGAWYAFQEQQKKIDKLSCNHLWTGKSENQYCSKCGEVD